MDPFSLDHIIKSPFPIHYVKEQQPALTSLSNTQPLTANGPEKS